MKSLSTILIIMLIALLGAIEFIYAEPLLKVNTLSPTAVVRTEPVQFAVVAQNTGSISVSLDTQTLFEFTDGAHPYSATLYSAITITNGTSTTLSFSMRTVHASFTTGTYTPSITFHGTTSGATYTQVLTLSANTVEVRPNIVQLGEVPNINWPRNPSNYIAGYGYLIWIANTSGTNIAIDQRTRIAVTDGIKLYALSQLAIPTTLHAHETTKIEFNTGDFSSVTIGQYNPILTLIGDSYAQTMILNNNLVTVNDSGVTTIGVSPASISNLMDTFSIKSAYSRCMCTNPCDVFIKYSLLYGPDSASAGEYSAPAFCDIDGDGKLDFFSGGDWIDWAKTTTGTITFGKNTGTLGIPAWAELSSGYESIRIGAKSRPAFVDLDHDEDYDLCLGDVSGKIWFYRNLGTSTAASWMSSPRLYPTISVGSCSSPAFVDIDADGDFDLFIGCADGRLWYAENTGTASLPRFATPIQYGSISVASYSAPAFVDIDGDGDKDLFIGCGDGTLTFYRNIGTATTAVWDIAVPNYNAITVGNRATPTFADIDNDGDYDLFFGQQSTGIIFYRNTGTRFIPTWTQEPFSPVYMQPPKYPAIIYPQYASTSFITDPNCFYINGSGDFWTMFGYPLSDKNNYFLNVKYRNNLQFTFSTYHPPSGGGMGVIWSFLVPATITIDDDCAAMIKSISSNTNSYARSEAFTVDVSIYNPKIYSLTFDLSTAATYLSFSHNSVDVSNKFSFSLISSQSTLAADSNVIFTFQVIPAGDAPVGDIIIDPVIKTTVAMVTTTLQASNRGSTEWPIPSILKVTLKPNKRIIVDQYSLFILESSTTAFQIKLIDQPTVDAVTVSVTYYTGAPDITVLSGATLFFTPSNWNNYQTVVLTSAQDTDTINDITLFRCNALGWTYAEVTAQEIDNGFIATDKDTIAVPEGANGSFKVKLGCAPAANVTMTINFISGDTDISIQSATTLTFTPTNWNVYQIVTLTAAEDTDTKNNSAFFTCSVNGYIPKTIQAIEIDNDIITWSKTYGFSTSDYAFSIQQTSDDGYIFTGQSYCTGGSDVWVVKLDKYGSIIWQKDIGGSGLEKSNSIKQTFDGGYIIAGLKSLNPTYLDYWLIKLDLNGNIVWQKAYENSGNSEDEAFMVQQSSDTGFIVVGKSYGSNDNGWILKLDTTGNIIWQKLYGGTNSDMLRAIQPTADNGYIVTGYTNSYGAGASDIWVLKLDQNGDIQWQKTFGGTNNEDAYSIQTTTDGGYIVGGNAKSFGAGGSDAWILKLDQNGIVQWQKTYGSSSDDYVRFIQPCPDNGYIVTGYTNSFGAGQNDYWMFKLDQSGNIEWQRSVGGINTDEAYCGRPTNDGGFIFAGSTYSFGAGAYDVLALKTNTDGVVSPLCYRMVTTNAIINIPSITTTNSTSAVVNTSATVNTTSVGTLNTNATISTLCSSLLIVTDKDELNVPEGSTANFRIKLGFQPSTNEDVVVRQLNGDSDISVQSGPILILTFTPSNWSTYRNVTLTAAEDSDAIDGSATILCAINDMKYPDVYKEITATESDNDRILVVNTTLTMIPKGGTNTFQVKLLGLPADNVTVTVNRYSGDTAISIQSATTFNFSTTNWNSYQTVTVSASTAIDPQNGVAVFRCDATGWTYKSVTAIAINNECIRVISAIGTTLFYLGTGTDYTPITFNVKSILGTDTVTILVFDTKHPAADDSTKRFGNQYFLSRWYQINHTGGIVTTDIKFSYVNFDFTDANFGIRSESQIEIAKYGSNSTWQWYSANARDTIANWVQLNNITSFSDWTLSGPGGIPVELSRFEASEGIKD